MENYTVILVLLGIMIVISTIAENLKFSMPIVLIFAGIGLGFIPGMPTVQINSEIIFLLFLPPLLYDASFKIPLNDFKANLSTISSLAITLVFLTTAGLAAISYYLIPGMTWPLAFVLGAILAPTDAVAALSITKGLKLSSLSTTILEGESLINDASALVAFRFAIAAVTGSVFIWYNALLTFVILLAGGFLVGFLIAKSLGVLLRMFRNNTVTILSLLLLAPFVTYLVAEKFHTSGVIAVVTLGFSMSRLSQFKFPDHVKHQSETIWDMVTFMLNGLIFILIGLEFPIIVEELSGTQLLTYAGIALLLTFTALVIRTWNVYVNRRRLLRAYHHPKLKGTSREIPQSVLISLQDSMVISWSGMRGIISLAIAMGLPYVVGENGVPMKNVIIYITTVVVLITVVGQGLLLPRIVKRGEARFAGSDL
ncbi:CPA1 family monovalent cation:H+ antiporter [Chitinophaga skermanii]|uniref:CPA1 family monovalent cation:H+ antiporter n=1 Tax=Chitinophaga skermanii TaxID=331697 RepID=A0A327QMI8_9BACT|nr:cation:proton antiporter [Chitinophaga skermanii]RAJ05471.1 CPA1 family monovalent cation:H+ antiporter [Chitinophaga skermanii]